MWPRTGARWLLFVAFWRKISDMQEPTDRQELRLLGDLLARATARWPERTLLARENPALERPTSYRDFYASVRACAAALLARGLAPGDRVALFADNCKDWLLVDQALALAGLVSVPRGTDTAAAELDLILEHSGARALFVETEEQFERLSAASRRLMAFTLQKESSASFATLEQVHAEGLKLMSSGKGEELLKNALAATDPKTACTIVYTSGTTGQAKGVMLSHENVISNVLATIQVLEFKSGMRMLSILPSWHMFERILEYIVIHGGCTLVYTDQRRLMQDLREVKPEVVAFVPRIWERIGAGMRKKLDGLPRWKRALLAPVFWIGKKLAKRECPEFVRPLHRSLSKILLSPVWKAIGGRLVIPVSGGGSLPEDVDLLFLSLGIPLLNGYGLTETSPVLSLRTARGNRLGAVGRPLPDTEFRIVRKDGTIANNGERGEIHARGPQIMLGYYRDEALTRSVLSDDAWFRTGDLGLTDRDGWLYITGRIKDTIVLGGGENVEPEPIECQLRMSPFISQVLLVGQDAKSIAALVVPEAEAFEERLGMKESELDSPQAKKILRKELDRLISPDAGFRAVDRVGPFAVVLHPFTTSDGTMTATLKLKRNVITQRYAGLIDEIYGRK